MIDGHYEANWSIVTPFERVQKAGKEKNRIIGKKKKKPPVFDMFQLIDNSIFQLKHIKDRRLYFF